MNKLFGGKTFQYSCSYLSSKIIYYPRYFTKVWIDRRNHWHMSANETVCRLPLKVYKVLFKIIVWRLDKIAICVRESLLICHFNVFGEINVPPKHTGPSAFVVDQHGHTLFHYTLFTPNIRVLAAIVKGT